MNDDFLLSDNIGKIRRRTTKTTRNGLSNDDNYFFPLLTLFSKENTFVLVVSDMM